MPWDDPSAVVDVILKLRTEPELRSRMGANGHKVALDRLSGYFVGIMNGMANRLRDEPSHDPYRTDACRRKTTRSLNFIDRPRRGC